MILIIDDDRSVRLSLGLLFRQAGYESEGVGTEAEALALVREICPDLILLDMNLSLTTTGRDGINLLRKIRIFRPDVPVILISAWGTIPLAVEGMELGACDFITKPWDNRALMAKVRRIIDSSRAAAAHQEPAPTLDEMERKAIVEALRRCDYNLSQAAAELGITRQSLYRRMLKFDIK